MGQDSGNDLGQLRFRPTAANTTLRLRSELFSDDSAQYALQVNALFALQVLSEGGVHHGLVTLPRSVRFGAEGVEHVIIDIHGDSRLALVTPLNFRQRGRLPDGLGIAEIVFVSHLFHPGWCRASAGLALRAEINRMPSSRSVHTTTRILPNAYLPSER
jgi:hypothetical protein